MNGAELVAVVIPTRNRGAGIVDTVQSLLENDYPNFEIVVVDQSTGTETATALESFRHTPSLRYFQTATKGASTARNIGLSNTAAPYVLFTDDDCTVPSDWVSTMVSKLHETPRAALVFCSVIAGPHDPHKGTIPNHEYSTERTVNSITSYFSSIGMSAGLAGRRAAIDELGAFDPNLGPGSTFRCAEDHDLALRALLAGWAVIETPDTSVVHHGFRTFEEFRELTGRDWYGLGAAQAKHVRSGHLQVCTLVAYNSLVRGLIAPASIMFRLKRPRGFKRFYFFWKGFFHAWRTPVNRQLGLFVIEDETT